MNKLKFCFHFIFFFRKLRSYNIHILSLSSTITLINFGNILNIYKKIQTLFVCLFEWRHSPFYRSKGTLHYAYVQFTLCTMHYKKYAQWKICIVHQCWFAFYVILCMVKQAVLECHLYLAPQSGIKCKSEKWVLDLYVPFGKIQNPEIDENL